MTTKTIKNCLVIITSTLLLSACGLTRHTPGAFNDACIGIPIWIVNCFQCWMAVVIVCGLFLPRPFAYIFGALFPLDEDHDENIRAWIYSARLGAILAIGALVCFYVFMYPDSQAIASGASSCSSVITPFGGQ